MPPQGYLPGGVPQPLFQFQVPVAAQASQPAHLQQQFSAQPFQPHALLLQQQQAQQAAQQQQAAFLSSMGAFRPGMQYAAQQPQQQQQAVQQQGQLQQAVHPSQGQVSAGLQQQLAATQPQPGQPQ